MLNLSVDPCTDRRLKSTLLLDEQLNDFLRARDVEALIFSSSPSVQTYVDKLQQVVVNLRNNPALLDRVNEMPFMDDTVMARDTILEDIERETNARRKRFEQIMQEKYDMVNKASVRATLRCRRCGSSELSWEQKQTRGADGASATPPRRFSCSSPTADSLASRLLLVAHRVDDGLLHVRQVQQSRDDAVTGRSLLLVHCLVRDGRAAHRTRVLSAVSTGKPTVDAVGVVRVQARQRAHALQRCERLQADGTLDGGHPSRGERVVGSVHGDRVSFVAHGGWRCRQVRNGSGRGRRDRRRRRTRRFDETDASLDELYASLYTVHGPCPLLPLLFYLIIKKT